MLRLLKSVTYVSGINCNLCLRKDTRYANQGPFEPQKGCVDWDRHFDGEPYSVPPSEMLRFLSQMQRRNTVRPRIIWFEYPFYTVVHKSKQRFHIGFRPEDCKSDVINQRVWKKHQTYISRLGRFPLEKAEYYLNLKESHGINSIRELSSLTGEDWSFIARILKTLTLPESVKN